MKTTIIVAVVIMIFILFIRVYHTPSQQTKLDVRQVGLHSTAVYHSKNLYTEPPSAKYRYGCLQLYPIFASNAFLKHHEKLGPYLSLHEALDQKKIIITELTSRGDQPTNATALHEQESELVEAEVNRLFAENISSDTIIILGGEVIRGGKQDRMIAQDFMILPHSGKVDIAVYCVEHGRWAVTDADQIFSIAMDVAPNRVRRAAKESAAQEEVWAEIEELSEDFDVRAPTQALVSAVADSKFEKSIQPYKHHLEKIDWPQSVVGVIAVMGKEFVGVDVFAQHQLFIKYYPSLLSSYSSDAYAHRDSTVIPYTEVQFFLKKLIRTEEAFYQRIQKGGTQLEFNGYRIHAAVYSDADEEGMKR